MKTKDFEKYLDNVLITEARKLIKEQVEGDDLLGKIKSFKTLSGLVDKISVAKQTDNGINLSINNLTNQDLINCCGGDTIETAENNLLKGLHKDLKLNGLGENFDIDLSIEGENNIFNLEIMISSGEDLGDEELDETFPPSNDPSTCEPCKKDKKSDKLLLGDKKINEQKNMKKIVRLTESQFEKFIKKILNESETNQPYTKPVGKVAVDGKTTSSVPGLDVTKKAQNDSKKENDDNTKDVEKKMKDYLSFDGNDNPEFPKQIGKGEKVARENTSDQEQEIEDNRGRGPQDLEYDTDFAEKQTERIKKALSGDSTMGNEQDKDTANVVKSDLGKKIEKNMKRRQEIKKEEPLYNRAAVPTTKEKKPVNEEIEKMKNLIQYNKRTQ